MELDKKKFEFVGSDGNESEAIVRPNISYWADAWRRLKKNKVALVSLFLLIVVILLCFILPLFMPYKMNDQNYQALNKGPSLKHLFGTDNLGRDLFVRTLVGGRVSLYIGFAGTAVELLIGCIYGGISGYVGGKTDLVLMRVVEIISSIPYLIIVILLLLVLPKGINTIIIALCITGWVGIARLVRGQVMQLKNSEYVMAAKALGASPMRIIVKHLLPNTIGIILVYMSMDIPGFIFDEAFLSWLGLGVQSPNTSWGALIMSGQGQIFLHPYQLLIPVGILCVTILAFNLLGDGLRDALDPKLRQ